MDKVFIETLRRGLADRAIPVSELQLRQMERYAQMLLEWNEKINLTAITEPDQVAVKHFLDSLLLLPFLPEEGEMALLDVGTGAGFPGLPLKILRPEIRLTLLDSLQKRCKFLQAVVDDLGLTGVTVVHGRAEEKGRDPQLREKFHLVTARAVTRLPVLSEYCLPFLRQKGLFAAYKGPDIAAEVAEAKGALKILGGRVKNVQQLILPISAEPRSIVLITKVSPTPSAYPRRAGVPEKSPL